jgi:hypothetical protein
VSRAARSSPKEQLDAHLDALDAAVADAEQQWLEQQVDRLGQDLDVENLGPAQVEGSDLHQFQVASERLHELRHHSPDPFARTRIALTMALKQIGRRQIGLRCSRRTCEGRRRPGVPRRSRRKATSRGDPSEDPEPAERRRPAKYSYAVLTSEERGA